MKEKKVKNLCCVWDICSEVVALPRRLYTPVSSVLGQSLYMVASRPVPLVAQLIHHLYNKLASGPQEHVPAELRSFEPFQPFSEASALGMSPSG